MKQYAKAPAALRGASAAIQVISKDRELHRLCMEIAAELPHLNLGVVGTETYKPGLGPVICVWDCSNATPPPELPGWDAGQGHLFVLDRSQVGTILDTLPCAPIGLLLKPITKATLAAFLMQAVAALVGADGDFRSDRSDILQCLLQANLRLQEYDQDRTNFLARATHDFRAPLTALSGYCGLMLEGLLGPLAPEQREVLQRMQHSAHRLVRMASSLFDLSVAWRLPMRLQLQPHPIDDCVEQALHELAFLTEEKGISVTVQLAPSPGSTLWFDSTRVGQVLVNLLDNACRFTPKYGSIEIFGYPYFWERRSPSNLRVAMERRKRKCEEPNSYRLNMTDTGPEIPKTFLPLLFEEYTSYSGPADRSGAGLGLAICRTIARAHQGDIWVVSETGGVTFSVVLPFQLADSQLMDRPPHDMRVTADRL